MEKFKGESNEGIKARTIAKSIFDEFKNKSGLGFSESAVIQKVAEKAQEEGVSFEEIMNMLEFERGGDVKENTSTAYSVHLKE